MQLLMGAAQWAQGNGGAISFLMQALPMGGEMPTPQQIRFALKMTECTSIRGTNLWVLFSDLCDKDMTKVDMLCEFCPNDVLEDACSRQDYSGRKLVAQYLGE